MAFEKFKKRRAAELARRKIRSDRVKLLLLERGLSVFSKFGVSKVIVFGSVADGVCSEMSDTDILVMPLKNNQYWDFRYELEEAVDLPIDLYTDLDIQSWLKRLYHVEKQFMKYEFELLKAFVFFRTGLGKRMHSCQEISSDSQEI
jgi:predicted nucleotidyltransferase